MTKHDASVTDAAVLYQSLELLDDAPEAIADAETMLAALHEVEQRIRAGRITREERTDLGGDLVALAEALSAFAIRVLA